MTALRVAFIGLGGAMGRPIAGRLVGAGFPMTLWNRTSERGSATKTSPLS